MIQLFRVGVTYSAPSVDLDTASLTACQEIRSDFHQCFGLQAFGSIAIQCYSHEVASDFGELSGGLISNLLNDIFLLEHLIPYDLTVHSLLGDLRVRVGLQVTLNKLLKSLLPFLVKLNKLAEHYGYSNQALVTLIVLLAIELDEALNELGLIALAGDHSV